MMHLPTRISASAERRPRRAVALGVPLLLALLAGSGCHGPKATVSAPPPPAPPAEAPETKVTPLSPPTSSPGQVIDMVIANVAGRIVLYSDLAGQLENARRSGEKITDATTCDALEDLLFQQLLLEQARIDSVVVDDKQVDAELERRIRYFEQQIGGREALEKFYGKKEEEIKADFRGQIRDQLVAQQMQQQITGDRHVTPREVERFYNNIPKDSLPLINAQVEYGSIVKYALPSEAEDRRIQKKLEDLRTGIVSGAKDFAAMATIYSDDPGSASKGGELGMVPSGVMVPEFDAVALSLKDGEVSQVFKTEFGYHIMQMIERRGEQYNARHILLKPKTSPEDLARARAYLDSVAVLIRDGKISFAQAARELNDDEDTRGTNGVVIEPNSNSQFWAIGDLDQKVFFVLDKLSVGSISEAKPFTTDDGKDGYRIFMLMKRTEPHTMDLVRDYPLVSDAAERQQADRNVSDWIKDKVGGVYIRISPDYAGCHFRHPWVKPPSP